MLGRPGFLNLVSPSKPGMPSEVPASVLPVDGELVQRVEVDAVVADPEIVEQIRLQRVRVGHQRVLVDAGLRDPLHGNRPDVAVGSCRASCSRTDRRILPRRSDRTPRITWSTFLRRLCSGSGGCYPASCPARLRRISTGAASARPGRSSTRDDVSGEELRRIACSRFPDLGVVISEKFPCRMSAVGTELNGDRLDAFRANLRRRP